MSVPVFALAVQALRVGSVARDRRMSALRLAGATPRDVRAVAAAEAGGAALLGGLLAGPAYLALFVLLGRLLPGGNRLLPTPSVADLLVWLIVVALLGLLGVLAGAAVERRVLTNPLGVHRRVGAAPPGRRGCCCRGDRFGFGRRRLLARERRPQLRARRADRDRAARHGIYARPGCRTPSGPTTRATRFGA